MRSIFLFAALLLCSGALSQQTIDVQHYRYQLALSDASDAINGKADITLRFLNDATQFSLDLASVDGDKGMQVFLVREKGLAATLSFLHRNNKLVVQLPAAVRKGEQRTFEIEYIGIPKDGLIISTNKYGDRTFFSDNWPDRAHQWIPCNDHPSDKATVEFEVTAPAHYRVVSNGSLVSETVSGPSRLTHWKETALLPTKVMVIGVARFAVARVDSSYRLPVTAWVYPQDSAKGVYDYALADAILRFFESYIGPYPYSKLANVQSKTIFGGMENANAIFYAEATVTGDRSSEPLIAHEIAHQWFGNTASETSFSHLWLSEGFATYLTDIFLEGKYGRESFLGRLKGERKEVVAFAKQTVRPVVDSVSPYMELLNPNSYQKGAWVLHMLRSEVGDPAFQKIIRTYYASFKDSNAATQDFAAIAEAVSERKLDVFFDQWLYRPGVPELGLSWKKKGGEWEVVVSQGNRLFQVDLELEIIAADQTTLRKRLSVKDRETVFRLTKEPKKIILDPDVKLLFAER